ncbi:MAG TPA: sulfite reductase subunit alpha [Verrucomicrobiae bacterium]|jgi:sulfite reductase (NADPH) flavoprotein alpha-component
MTSPVLPYIPEAAPFSVEQRAWLNGYLAGLFMPGQAGAASPANGSAAPSANAEPLLILFGSQTGTAEGLAKKVAKEAGSRGFAPKVLALNDHGQANLAAASKAVIISSTWGDGEPPDNAVNFWNWLHAESTPRLENLNFAILGLGDKNYSDFCGASKKMDARLEALGAKRLYSRGECDVDYETTAKHWIDGLWEKLGGSTNGASQNGNHSSPAPLAGKEEKAALQFSKSNPFPARLLNNVLLNKPGSGKEVRHYEIALGGSGLAYEVGDALGVIPENNPELVEKILAAFGATGDEPVQIENSIQPLRLALTQHFDVAKPPAELLAKISKHDSAGEIKALLAPNRADDLRKWLFGRDVLDILSLAPKQIVFTEILPLLKKITPRLYSISSSPKAHPGEVHLTVGAVRYEIHGRKRGGVASTFLADFAAKTGAVKVFVQPSHGFKPPMSGDTPMIMIGPGTGIAPFRAFLEERAALGAKGKNWLFFGDQCRATDFLYEEQLTAWKKSGLLTRLDLAFSRDQKEKIYVQDRMIENAAELWAWLEAGAHFYVCGDASRMAKDVDAALHKVIENGVGKSADDAKAYVAKLKSDKRYQRDVY